MAEHPPRILVVEDDIHELDLTLRGLKAGGLAIDIETARDGAEALDRLLPPGRGPVPILILLDLKLPGLGGVEVARRLKAEPATRSIPVVVFSSSLEPQDLRETYRAGVNGYIVKPVDYDRLLALLAQVARYWVEINRTPGSLP